MAPELNPDRTLAIDDSGEMTHDGRGLDQFTSEVAQTGLLLLAGNAVSTILLAIVTIFVARMLGPDAYGLYSLVLLTPTYLAFAIDLGLPTALMHFSARAHSESDEEKVATYMSTAVTAGLLLGILSTVVAVLSSSFISSVVISRPGTESLVACASVILAPQVVYLLLSQFFVAIKRPSYSAMIAVTQGLTKGITQLSLVLLSYSVAGAIVGHVAGTIITSLLGMVLLVVRIRPRKLIGIDTEALKRMLIYGLPFYICIFLYQSIVQYEGILMGELSTDAQIGNYKTATNFMFILTMTTGPLGSTFVPAFSRFDPVRDRPILNALFRKAIKYASLMTLPLAVGLIALSSDGVYALFGDQYAEAPIYLALLALHSLFSPIGANVIANSFNGLGKSHYVLAVNGSWTFFFMLFARPVTLWAGLPGMIVLFTASWIPAVLIGLIMADRKFGMRLDLSWSVRFYLVSLAAGLSTWGLVTYLSLGRGWPNLAIGIPAFAIIFLTLAPLLGTIDRDDVVQLRNLAEKTGILRSALKMLLSYEERLVSFSPFEHRTP